MKHIYLVIFVLSGVISSVCCAFEPPLKQIDAFKIISIEGEYIPDVLGMPLEQLSMAAMIDGAMEPIPYQIDQYNIGGAIYFDGWDVPMAGAPDVLDKTDKILFLFKDAGERFTKDTLYDGDLLAEILTRDGDGYVRYVYLVRHSRLRSDDQYVRYSAEEGLVETDFYSIRYNKNNHLEWLDFSYVNYVGEQPLDSLRLALRGGVLTSLVEVELNSDDLVALPKGELIGPIRTTTQLEFNVMLMSVPILNLSVQIHHAPKSLVYDVRGVIPEFRRSFVVDPTITMSIVANNLQGASIRTSGNPQLTGVVDGKIDDAEQGLIDTGLDPSSNWIWVSTKRNLDLLSYVDYLGGFDSKISLLLEDDLSSNGFDRQFARQLLNTGYVIEEFPKTGFVGVVVSLLVSNGFEGDPELFSVDARSLPEIEIRPFTPVSQQYAP